MGLGKDTLEFIERHVIEHFVSFNHLRMLELGDQEVSRRHTGKEYFEARGCHHVSIDRNGRNGALKYDLCKPLPYKEFGLAFDVVTNAGTSEHVRNQWACFRNVHESLILGGLMFHVVPDARHSGRWKRHGYFHYPMDFFNVLAKEAGYTVCESFLKNELIHICMQKRQPGPFMASGEPDFSMRLKKIR